MSKCTCPEGMISINCSVHGEQLALEEIIAMTDDLGKLSYPSETAKYLHLTIPYCHGTVLDIGSQGSPVVAWAWQLDLPPEEFEHYNGGGKPRGPIQFHGHMDSLPWIQSGSLDCVYCSHVLEDVGQHKWPDVLREWMRVVKPGGHIVILVPERERWAAALARGQSPNCSHAGPEPQVGDMSKAALEVGLEVIKDEMTDLWPEDYSILGIFKKP